MVQERQVKGGAGASGAYSRREKVKKSNVGKRCTGVRGII